MTGAVLASCFTFVRCLDFSGKRDMDMMSALESDLVAVVRLGDRLPLEGCFDIFQSVLVRRWCCLALAIAYIAVLGVLGAQVLQVLFGRYAIVDFEIFANIHIFRLDIPIGFWYLIHREKYSEDCGR